jgi:hypothetical protein
MTAQSSDVRGELIGGVIVGRYSRLHKGRGARSG